MLGEEQKYALFQAEDSTEEWEDEDDDKDDVDKDDDEDEEDETGNDVEN